MPITIGMGDYRYEYRPGPPIENPPEGCRPGAQSFTMSARPLEYGKGGRRSFFLDESGEIRSTVEDRAATAEDPPL